MSTPPRWQPTPLAALATRAGVSRAWLYAETELRDDVQHLRAGNRARAPQTER